MTTLTKSFSVWLLKYHSELYVPISFGHIECITEELYSDYLNWCQTDEGRKHLKCGSKVEVEE